MRKGEQIDDSQPNYYARTRSRREQQNEAEFQLGYLLASIEQSINAYAEKTGFAYSVAHTTFRVAEILSSKALRQEPGLAQLLQQVRSNGASALPGAGDQSGESEFLAEEAVHVRPRLGRPLGRPRLPGADKRQAQILRARDLGRPLTQAEKRANWRIQAQMLRDRKAAERGHVGKVETGPAFEQQRAAALARKRVITPKQLRAMRRNAKLARAAHRAKKGTTHMSAERRAKLSLAMKNAYARKRAAEQGGEATT